MNTPNPRENAEARASAEARVLAVLLGEADPVEAAAVDELLRADAGLRAYRDALLETLPLLREAGRLTQATPDLRMDESRRAALLEQLRVPSSRKGKGNVIPWTKWLRQNWSALAACGALLVGGATAILVLDQPNAVTISSQDFAKENDVFATGAGGGTQGAPRRQQAQPLPLSGAVAAAEEKMVPLEVELPPAMLTGTPVPISRWAADGAAVKLSPSPAPHPVVTAPRTSSSSMREDAESSHTTVKIPSRLEAEKKRILAEAALSQLESQWIVKQGALEIPPEQSSASAPETHRATQSLRSLGTTFGSEKDVTPNKEKQRIEYNPPPVLGRQDELDEMLEARGSMKNVEVAKSYRQNEKNEIGQTAVLDEVGKRSRHLSIDEDRQNPRGSVSTDEVHPKEKSSIVIAGKFLKKAKEPSAQKRAEISTTENPFSTFSLNVSDASFQLARAALQRRQWPDAAALRTEEFVNALRYGDAPPRQSEAVSLTQEQAHDPFLHGRTLLRLSVQTASAGRNARQPLNLTVLLDTSGSMERADRQEVLREALASLAAQLRTEDTVSVLCFARTPRLLLEPTRGEVAAEKLRQLVGSIPPEGGTNLSAALALAYAQNRQTRTAMSLNRIVLLTDGAANLGDADPAQLAALVKSQSAEEATLDCFGVGFDDYNDAVLEALARESHGRYAYLNSVAQAREDFARQLAGALQVAAKNVKVQVEFNPERVSAHHLFGYEKHQLRAEEFRDNTVRAAELGAAESGTALYRVALRTDGRGEIGTVRVRYQDPRSGEFRERSWVIPFEPVTPLFDQAAPGIRWATVAAYFAEKLQSGSGSEMVSLSFLRDTARLLTAAELAPEANQNLREMLEQASRLE